MRTLIAALSIAIAAQPVLPALLASTVAMSVFVPRSGWAQTFEEAAEEGQALGESLLVGPSTDGDRIFFDGATGVEAIDIDELFQAGGSEDDRAAMEAAFGSEAAAQFFIGEATGRLATEDSAQAEAVRTVRETARARAHPDLINDPALRRSADILDGDDPVFDTFFTECEAVAVAGSGQTVHVPEYAYCDRVVSPVEQCELLHDYDVGVLEVAGGGGSVASCGPGCLELSVGQVGDNYWAGNCTVFEQSSLINVLNPEAIVSATLEQATWDDYMQIWVDGEQIWQGPNGNFPPETAGACELSTSWNEALDVDLTQTFQDSTNIEFLIRVSVTGNGEGYARIRVRYDESQVVRQDDWTIGPECGALFQGIEDGACNAVSMTCIDGPSMAESCITLNGIEVCRDDLSAAPIAGYSPLCRRGVVQADCGFAAGEVCFTGADGIERCVSGEAGNECAALEQRAECAFVESQCIDGAEGDSGTCYAFSETWDCGYDVEVPGSETRTMSCGGPIRCMGDECVSQVRETNPDFVQASATLTGVQYMAMDMACPGNDPASCEIFAGEAMECKRALGGFVDCCETPEGISLADYLQLSLASYDLAKKIRLGEGLAGAGLDVPGAWSAIADFGSATFPRITKPFTSAWGSLTQSYGGATLEAIESFSLEELKATMVSAVGEFVANSFGAEVAGLFFDPVLDTGGEVIGYTLNSAVGTALSVIMWAYTIYTIINILAHIIWECEEEEFILGARRELQSCHRVGSYCADDTILGCIERRDAYCCYNSPFARIVQQSARPQLGLDFGDPMAPTCDGFTVAELSGLDWDQIDLEEWYGILAANGVIPDARPEFEAEFSLENATRNEWAVLPAPHGGERIQERIDAAGMDEARERVRGDLWDGIN